MTVYVDDMQMLASVGHVRGKWSHMMADSVDELITFAEQLGLRRSWLQDKRSGVHFDVTEAKRQAAIRNGARVITCSSDEWRRVVAVARQQHEERHTDCPGLMCGQGWAS